MTRPALAWPLGLPVPFRPQERFSAVSHLLAVPAALFGSVVLALHAQSPAHRVVALIYGLSMTLMFTASAVYHAFKTVEGGHGILRRLDHVSIFFMIAGSYTPICYVHLSGAWRWAILGVVWGLVLAGILFKLLFLSAPRFIGAAIYLVMGWIVVIPYRELLNSLPGAELRLIILGGLAYSLGALIYAVKRPNPWPGAFGFHEIFHVLVLVGAATHYVVMYRILG